MITEQKKIMNETSIPPELIAKHIDSLVRQGNYFGVLEIHIERKIVRIKNRQTYLREDLEELVR